ncbi:hypothetical protein QUA11_33720, partial [Microcoleus sp. S13_D1]
RPSKKDGRDAHPTFKSGSYLILIPNTIGNLNATQLSSSLIRRICFERVGGYNCQWKAENAQGCEDLELFLRIAEHYQFKVVPEFLVGYRQISSRMSCNYAAMAKSHSLIMADVRERHPEIPANIYPWYSSSFYI